MSNKSNKKKKSNYGKTSKDTLKRKLGKVEYKQGTKSHIANGQKKFQRKAKCSTEVGSPEIDPDIPNEEEGIDNIIDEQVICRADDKKGKRYSKKSNKNDYQIKFKLGRNENSQNEFFNLGEKCFEVPSENEGEATRQRMAYPPHYVQTPLDRNDPDVAQQQWTRLPEYVHTPLYKAPNPDISKQRLTYTTGQSQMSTPVMWKYTNIPYDNISQISFPTSHDQNQLVYNRQKKQDSSVPIPMQNEIYSKTLNDRKPCIEITCTDPKQLPSHAMVLEHQLGYFPGNEFRKNEIPRNAIPGQSISTNDRNHGVLAREIPRITPNQPQIFSNAQQLLTTQHFQEPTTHASPNRETDGELLEPIPPAIYPLEYQVPTLHGLYGMTEGMVGPQGSPHEKYGKDQHLSSSNRYHQINTTPGQPATVSTEQMTIPNLGGMESSFTAFPKSRYSNGLVHDQNSTYPAAENKTEKHQRSISTQPTRRDMETTSGTFRRTRQSENAKRPSFQMIQQKFQEPLQRVTPVTKNDDSAMYSQYEVIPPGTEDILDEEKTGVSEERFIITTPFEAQGSGEIDESRA